MALRRNERYPGRFDNPSPEHPQGAFKNRTAPNAKDGSYLERDWSNDWDGFFSSLMVAAGMTANGNIDNALSSQYFDALKYLFAQNGKNILNLGDVAKLGVATNAQMQTGTSTMLLPTVAAVMSMFSKRSFSINDYIRIPDVPGGLIIQWGSAPGTDASGLSSMTLPTNFPTNGLWGVCAYYNGTRNSISTQIASITPTTVHMFASQSTTGSAAAGAQLRYVVIGF